MLPRGGPHSELGYTMHDLRVAFRVFGFLVLLSSLLLTLGPAQATRVRPLNLEEMSGRAQRIFWARCVEVGESPEGFAQATFEVQRAVKGVVGPTVTVKLSSAIPIRFDPGQEVVLFLYGENAGGLTSPVGLGQGTFVVVRDKHGLPTAVNSLGNKTLFRDLSDAARQRLAASVDLSKDGGPMSPERLLDLANSLAFASEGGRAGGGARDGQ